MEPLSSYYYIKSGEMPYNGFEDDYYYFKANRSEAFKEQGDKKERVQARQANKKIKVVLKRKQ